MESSHNMQDFIAVNLPDYKAESDRVVKLVIGAAIFWVFVLPSLACRPVPNKIAFDQEKEKTKTNHPPVVSQTKKSKRMKNAKVMEGTPTQKQQQQQKLQQQQKQEQQQQQQPQPAARYIPLWANLLALTGLLTSTVYIVMTKSPYNYYTPRRVFQAPILTRQECQHVIAMAEQAAQLNVPNNTSNTTDPLLQEPQGWQKARHGTYPTTDLNLVTDPFTKEDRAWLSNLLDRRLSPSLERFFGIPATAIRMNDLFVVRYDAKRRTRLGIHTDNADLSFNILLTQDFQGGGTRFWNRVTKKPFAHLEPTQAGTGILHGSQIKHEGYPVSSGTRIILVGFTSVDRFDPWTRQTTGLSWMASWLNMAWVHIRCRVGYFGSISRLKDGQVTKWYDVQFVRLLFRDLINVLELIGDHVLSHDVTTVVSSSNATAYLQAMDEDYDMHGKYKSKANWFKGQNVDLEVDGTIAKKWKTRIDQESRFAEL